MFVHLLWNMINAGNEAEVKVLQEAWKFGQLIQPNLQKKVKVYRRCIEKIE